jgi:alkylation response protein AidB-like acyl-CoA dehydrogenase
VDFGPTDEQALLRQSVREFAEAEIRPHVMAWDEAQQFPMALLPKLAALGLMGIQLPEEYGGAAMSAVDYCICIEELARVCPAIALSVAAHNGLCASHIAMFASDAQKREYLPRLVTGEVLGAWALTEAGAGSDAAGMRTTATRLRSGVEPTADASAERSGASRGAGDPDDSSNADCWVLNGAKTFITHGRIGGVMVVMAVTDPSTGHRGISAFVLEHGTPGMSAGKKENKLGMRASDTSEVIFQDCRIPASHLLGEEGHGFIDTLQVLDAGRIGIAALAVGLAQGAYEAARNYARERRQFGQPIAAFQAIQWKLADNATRIEAARLLTYRAAYLKDQGKRTTSESAMAKLFASETAVKAADDCVQVHGGYGFVKDYPAEKFFRDVKLLTIGEGTSEIQRLVIARRLLGQ